MSPFISYPKEYDKVVIFDIFLEVRKKLWRVKQILTPPSGDKNKENHLSHLYAFELFLCVKCGVNNLEIEMFNILKV